MRIGLVHDPYSPISMGNIGGEDNLVELETSLLEARGHDVLKIMRIFDGSKRKFIHAVVNATGRGLSPLQGNLEKKVDLIHTNNLSLVSGYSWLTKANVPIVSSFHNYRPICPVAISWREGKLCFECRDASPFSAVRFQCGGKIGIFGSIRQGLLQRNRLEIYAPSHLIFTSRKMADAYQASSRRLNFDILHNPSRLRVGSDSIELNDTTENPAKGFLFAGRLTPEKGILELIKEWPNDELLTIAGAGVLEKQVRQLCEVRGNIKFYGTFSPEYHDFYRNFEALVFPSSWLEGSPLVVIEAISTGVPVIATDTSSATEIIHESKCGVTIPQSFTTEHIRNAISETRANYLTLRKHGLEAGKSLFAPEVWAKNLESIFENVLTHK
jgi:glycosyltransferase involved in cell wall biosynthesis